MTRIGIQAPKMGNNRKPIAFSALLSETGLIVIGLGVLDFADCLPAWLVQPVGCVWLLSLLVLPFTAGFVGWRSFRASVMLLCAGVLFWLFGVLALWLSFAFDTPKFQHTRVPGVFGGYSVWLWVLSVLFVLPAGVMLLVHGIRKLAQDKSSTATSAWEQPKG